MDLGDNDEGFRRRLKAAKEARVVPWPPLVAREAFDPPLPAPFAWEIIPGRPLDATH